MPIITQKTSKIKYSNTKKHQKTAGFLVSGIKTLKEKHASEGLLESTYNKSNNSINSTKISVPFEIQKIKKEFREAMKDKKNQVVLFCDKEEAKMKDAILETYEPISNKAYALFPFYLSRYSASGQKQISKKIREKFDYQVPVGIFLTLTFDPSRYTLLEAWKILPNLLKKTMNSIRIYKNREDQKRGRKRKIEYVWVIEIQKNGYPHVHVFFAGLAYLLPSAQLRRIWGAGNIKVNLLKNTNVGSYMSKYLSKGQGLEEALPFIWKYHIRLYSSSNMKKIKKTKEHNYVYLGSTTIAMLDVYATEWRLREVEFFGGGGISIETCVDVDVGLKCKLKEELPIPF